MTTFCLKPDLVINRIICEKVCFNILKFFPHYTLYVYIKNESLYLKKLIIKSRILLMVQFGILPGSPLCLYTHFVTIILIIALHTSPKIDSNSFNIFQRIRNCVLVPWHTLTDHPSHWSFRFCLRYIWDNLIFICFFRQFSVWLQRNKVN